MVGCAARCDAGEHDVLPLVWNEQETGMTRATAQLRGVAAWSAACGFAARSLGCKNERWLRIKGETPGEKAGRSVDMTQ